MNMMQTTALARGAENLRRTADSTGRSSAYASKKLQSGKDEFSRIFDRSCQTNASVKENGIEDREKKSFKVSRESRRGDSNHRESERVEGKSVESKSVEGKSTESRTVDEKSSEQISLEEHPAKAQEVYLPMDVISQLTELLKVIGMIAAKESPSGAGAENGGSGEAGTLSAMLNPEQLKEGQAELRQILNQLISLLKEQGALTEGMSKLKIMAESGLNMSDEIPVKAFLDKLLETASKALESETQTKNGHVIPLETVIAAKLAPKAAALQKAAKGTVEAAPGGTGKETGTAVANAITGEKYSEADHSNGSGVGQNNQGADKNPVVSATGFGAQGNNQDSSVFIGDNGLDNAARIQLQPHAHVRQQPDVTSMTESGTASMPRMTQLIFGQIAEKARLVVSPDNTEMQIQLKPDFLGKLNLSVTSDNGVVTAKFTAESHAVKGIIEANLNTLKDALTQQGVKVDQLVVDVGAHNHQSGFDSRGGYYGNGSGKKNQISVNTQEAEKLFSAELQSGAIRDYYGSTVEYTA